MDDTNTPPATRRPLPARVYGLRLFYRAGFRRRITVMTAIMATIAYILRALQQLQEVGSADLRWDFVQFHTAAVDLAAGSNPYTAFLSSCPVAHWCRGGYIFPTLLAVAMQPLAHMPLVPAAQVWLVLTHLLLLLTLVVAWRGLRNLISPTTAALLVVATMLFIPLYMSLFFLQVGVLLVLLMTVAGVALVRGGRGGEVIAGVALGVAAVLRVTPLLLAPVLGRIERAASGTRVRLLGLLAMGATGLGLLVLLQVATPFTAVYFQDVLPRIGVGTIDLDNESLPGLLARAAALWRIDAPSATLVGVAATVAFVLPAWIAWQRTPVDGWLGGRRTRAAGFAAVLAAMPIVSSITWQHHLVSELVVLAFLAPALERVPDGAAAGPIRAARRLAVVSYLLLSIDRHMSDWVILNLGLAEPAGWRVVPFLVITSGNLIGMLTLWLTGLLVLAAARRPAAAPWASGAEPVDRHPTAVVHDLQPGGEPAHA
ncbi:MAG: hypothetical protein QOE92_195 [Chloroflexota bacterium]|jgi:hypothetical protein|nr:hypothetical protein [Chloroflexota bacterium]